MADGIKIGDAYWEITGRLEGLNAAMLAGRDQVQASVGQISSIAGAGLTAMGATIVGGLGYAVHEAAGFGAKMAEVATLGVKDLGALEEGAKHLSTTYGTDLHENVKQVYEAISAGIPEDAAILVLEAATKGAHAGVGSLTDAMQLGSAVLNAYGLNTGDAEARVKSFENIMGTAATAVNYGTTTFEQLGHVVGRVAPLASSAGIGMDDLFASLAATTSQGIRTNESVTGLKATIQAVVKPSQEASDVANALGVSFNRTTMESKGLSQFLVYVREEVKKNGPAVAALTKEMEKKLDAGKGDIEQNKKQAEAIKQQIETLKEAIKVSKESKQSTEQQEQQLKALEQSYDAASSASRSHKESLSEMREKYEELKGVSDDELTTLATLFGSVEALNTVLAMSSTGGLQVYKKSLDDMANAQQNLNEMSEAFIRENPEIAFKALQNTIKILAIDIGKAFLPVVHSAAEALLPVVGYVSDLVTSFPTLSTVLFTVAGGVGALALAFGPLLMLLPQLAGLGAGLKTWLQQSKTELKETTVAVEQATTSYNNFSQEIAEAEANLNGYINRIKESEAALKQQEQALKSSERAVAFGGVEYKQAEQAVEKNRQALISSNQELTESEQKFAAVKAEVADFTAGINRTGISAAELRQKFLEAKQAVEDNRVAVQQHNKELKESKTTLEQVGQNVKELQIRLEGAQSSTNQAGNSLEMLRMEAKQAGVQFDMLKTDALILGNSLDTMAVSANRTRGQVSGLGSKLGNAGGLATDVLQLFGITSPATMKLAEFGNVAAQVGFMVGGAGTAAVAASGAVNGLATASQVGTVALTGTATAAQVAGGGVLALIGSSVALAAAIGILIGELVLIGIHLYKTADAYLQLQQSEERLQKQDEAYTQQLKSKGLVLNETAMAEMTLEQKNKYRSDMEKARSEANARAYFQALTGRIESEEEYAQMRNLMLNDTITAEASAQLVSKGLGEDKLAALMRMDEAQTRNTLHQLDIQQYGSKSVHDAITSDIQQAAQDREAAAIDAAYNIVAIEADASNQVAGFWASTANWIAGIWTNLVQTLGNMWQTVTGWASDFAGWLGFAGGGVIPGSSIPGRGSLQGFANGGVPSSRIVWVGERGPEPVALPEGSRVMSNSEMRDTLGVRSGTGSPVVNMHFHNMQIHKEVDSDNLIQRIGDALTQRLSLEGV